MVVAGLVLALAGLVGCGDDGAEVPAELSGIVREPLPVVDTVELPDATNDGEPLPFRADDQGLLLVYFGYTSCPDVCPTTMADLRVAVEGLDADADRVEVAMATIDPDRDSGEALGSYVQSFIEDGHALRTDDDELLRAATDAFGADYSVSEAEDGEIEVMHTGSVYVVDDEGRMLVQWPFGTSYAGHRERSPDPARPSRVRDVTHRPTTRREATDDDGQKRSDHEPAPTPAAARGGRARAGVGGTGRLR